jgi:hypothetical protein
MKIQKYNEVKDPIIGEEIAQVEVKVRFRTGKSRNCTGYSLRVTIDGLNLGEPILLGQCISEEQLIEKKEKFLIDISTINDVKNKFNI